MTIELAEQLWREMISFVTVESDIEAAAESVVEILLQHYDAEEINDAFSEHESIVLAVSHYIDEDLGESFVG